MEINWISQDTNLLLNPRLPEKEALLWKDLEKSLQDYPSHIWLSTSGSRKSKLVALHKNALLASAQAVNEHLQTISQDIWINPLPIFHVGGLGIWARAWLKSSKVYCGLNLGKWSPTHFCQIVKEKKGSLTSLVPTQVYDLAINNLSAPPTLRAVLVGGGALESSLYKKARQLGWPLLPSYGLTECASQVATAAYESLSSECFPELKLLSHVKVKIDGNACICISSSSLLTVYAIEDAGKLHLVDPLSDGYFISHDKGILMNNTLKLLGRVGDFVKIGGESVDVEKLKMILEEIKLQEKVFFDVVLEAVPDSRLGHVIHLFSTDKNTEILQREYNRRVLPFECIRKVHFVDDIPRSSTHKVLKEALISKDQTVFKS